MKDWSIEEKAEHIIIKKEDKNTTFPEVEVTIDNSLGFSISVYGWPLPSTHQIYKDISGVCGTQQFHNYLIRFLHTKFVRVYLMIMAVVSSIRF